MHTRRGQWRAAGWLLGAVLLGVPGTWAQNFTTGSGSGSSQSGSGSAPATLNNAPNFDPSAAAAAALVGNYRAPGATSVDPTGLYRVPFPDTSGGAAPTTSSTTGTTTNATTASSGAASVAPATGGASP